MKEIKEKLSKLTGKKQVYITRRGNVSIREALRQCKSKGYSELFIQDQGGWITYRQFADKLKLKLHEIKTNYGLVDGSFKECILLINTMPAYAYLQDVSKIKTEKCMIINDATGSIGNPQGKWGDIILGSFGEDKPIELKKAGFIAADFDIDIEEEKLTAEEQEKLLEEISKLGEKIWQFTDIQSSIKKDLKDYNIIHPEGKGINVIIKSNKKEEKEKIIEYCNKKGYEYTECPRYIRIIEEGISIEVKRMKQ
jgi:hypothetical protein